ncbi:MAG: DUF1203 domain-containing protein [Alphaproteobacteria bacterium]|nr:DUF1203 domain-containing protein [Alphaproteobacteria bacterium]
MISQRFIAMPSETARSFREGMTDAHGQPPERHVSDGAGNPCRHCLADIAEGAPFLILAWQPFPGPQPYAETGPVFLHAEDCERHGEADGMPAMFLGHEQLLLRGYGHDDRIVYGTGQIVAPVELERAAASLLDRPDIAYLHVRSAGYNCYQCRIERAPPGAV